ncbi:pantoate--beta-alanine ligase [Naumannella huperziae]
MSEQSRPRALTEPAQLRAWTDEARAAGRRIGLVPTMGNLHAGHLSLVAAARERADAVLVSIFVNPTQFGDGGDFDRYPRTVDADLAALADRADAVWLPSVEAMYPFGPGAATTVHVPGLTDVLEGAHRPGHFDGVASVVTRLFNQSRAEVAVFGEKDYQQLQVIRRMVADLSAPIEIVAAPTVREPDGLAMSSRNGFLDTEQRDRAGLIHRVLSAMADAARAGTSLPAVEAEAMAALSSAGFEPDYAVLRRADLSEPAGAGEAEVALVAARLGQTRLIDNLRI